METTVGERGQVVVNGVPFAPGQRVEVLVVAARTTEAEGGRGDLRNSVLEYHAPFVPVAAEDWDASR